MNRYGQISQSKIGVSVSLSSQTKLRVAFPVNVNELTQVLVNGIIFFKKGAVREVVRVAPAIFLDKHFKEVDDLIVSGMGVKGACEIVAVKYGFKPESLRQQFYKRHFNEKRKGDVNGL